MTDRVFIDECIKAINDYRRIHQAAPLTHNAVVSTTAQRWADHMTRTGSLGHNPNASYNGQPLGENCAYKWYSDKRDITGRTRTIQSCRSIATLLRDADSIWVIQGGAKNGASLFHCKYYENSMTELRGNW